MLTFSTSSSSCVVCQALRQVSIQLRHSYWGGGRFDTAQIIRSSRLHYRNNDQAEFRRFPVTVAHVAAIRCLACHHALAYRPGNIREVLTEHYRRIHPDALGFPVAVSDAGGPHWA